MAQWLRFWARDLRVEPTYNELLRRTRYTNRFIYDLSAYYNRLIFIYLFSVIHFRPDISNVLKLVHSDKVLQSNFHTDANVVLRQPEQRQTEVVSDV